MAVQTARPGRRQVLAALGFVAAVGIAAAAVLTAAGPAPPADAARPVPTAGADALLAPDGASLLAGTPTGIVVVDVGASPPTVRRTIPLGMEVRHLALSPDGATAYVLSADRVAAVDLAAGRVTASERIPGVRTDALTVAPDGRRVYVASFTIGGIDVLDATSLAGLGTIPLTESTEGAFLTSVDGRLGFVSTFSGVVVVDTTTLTPVRTIAVRTVGGLLGSADRSRVYVRDSRGRLVEVDTATGAFVGSLVLPPDGRLLAAGPGGAVYVLSGDALRVLDPDGRVRTTVPVAWPSGAVPPLVVDQHQRRVFVATDGDGAAGVRVISL